MMRLFRSLPALLVLATLSLGLGGCFLDNPLTGFSSTNIDTRLLGVFEFKDTEKKNKKKPAQPSDGDEVAIHRVAVLPLDANHYVIYYRDFSKKPAKTWKFIGWISRVDQSYYLTFRDETDGSGTFGKYGFVRFEWEFPGNFMVYAPDLTTFDAASTPYELRKAVRKGLKEGTLFPYESTWWQKIARIWWDPAGAEEGTSIPPEFEKGTTRDNPGL